MKRKSIRNSIRQSRSSWTPIDASTGTFKKLNNFGFVESCACSDAFDKLRDDGKKNVYFAVQDKDLHLSICYFDVTDEESTEASHLMDVTLGEGRDSLTSFGSKLSDAGILWLCVFNYNCVIGIDLLNRTVKHEFNNIACPNDLCISKTFPHILFVAGGVGIKSPFIQEEDANSVDETLAVMPPLGRVYQINTQETDLDKAVTIVPTHGLSSLAGIEHTHNKLYISQLYDIVRIWDFGLKRKKATVVWQGAEVGNGKDCYFADNIAIYDDTHLACSIYRKVNNRTIERIKNRTLAAAGWSMGKCFTTMVHAATCMPYQLDNGELLLQFSNADQFPNVCFMLLDTVSMKRWHFTLDNSQLNVPENGTFDGHVTHVQRHGGKIVFVNFKSEYVLMLDEKLVNDVLTPAKTCTIS